MGNNKQQIAVGLLIEEAQEWGEYKKTMSNNKQSMKLYTEEQVRLAMYFARGHNKMTDSQFIDSLIPIELPSHYEIWEEAIKEQPNQRRYDFMRGADWMRDKIQGGNK